MSKHQTLTFIDISPAALQSKNYRERVNKFLTSVNRPDTIKSDIRLLNDQFTPLAKGMPVELPSPENGAPVPDSGMQTRIADAYVYALGCGYRVINFFLFGTDNS